jgi:hypothetical protein
MLKAGLAKVAARALRIAALGLFLCALDACMVESESSRSDTAKSPPVAPQGSSAPAKEPAPLVNANGDPLPPKTHSEAQNRRNDNRQVRDFLVRSPFTNVTAEGNRVTIYFDGGDMGSPFIKVGRNALYCDFGSECMDGVIRINRFRWFAYRWQSRKDMMWLCMVFDKQSDMGCAEAQTARSRTAPEQYDVLVMDGQVFSSVLPASYSHSPD